MRTSPWPAIVLFLAGCAPHRAAVPVPPVQGSIDPRCTVERVCVPGYTRTVRPPASYTNALKRRQMAERGLTGSPADYEEDHFIPLALCGHPTDPANLWPEPWPDARRKDVDETSFHREVCTRRMTLGEAQRRIRERWRMR